MMKTLVCQSPGNLEFVNSQQPGLKKDHALLRIHRIGICGTDLHAFEGTQPYFTYPRILGHELAAEFVDADGAEGFSKGELVTIIPYFNCGSCIACRSGKPNCCVQMQVCGVHTDGGMREYLLVPSYSLLHGHGLSADELALTEPLAIGAHAISRANIQKGEWVLVVGAGPIGLGIIAFAAIAGANLVVLDVNESRLSFCRDQLPVKHTINAVNEDVMAALKEYTGGDMPTVVIDATGNLKAINNAFQYLAHGGRYVLVGLQKGDIQVSHPEFHKREATLMSSRNAVKKDFEFVIDCIKDQRIKPLNFITHRVSFEKTADEFASWLNPANGVIKAMVEMS
jgi:2-desacetyl-2-hydroxyethyl bacteriochlorophyllide A dehydrogenase